MSLKRDRDDEVALLIENSDEDRMIPMSIKFEMVNFLISTRCLVEGTASQQEKLQANHQAENLILKISNLPLIKSEHNHPIKRIKLDSVVEQVSKTTSYKIERQLTNELISHLVNVIRLASDPMNQQIEELKIASLILAEKLLTLDYCQLNDRTPQHQSLGLYSSELDLIADETTGLYDSDIENKPRNSLDRLFNFINQQVNENVRNDSDKEIRSKLSDESNVEKSDDKFDSSQNAYFDNGINKWQSAKHTDQDIVNWLRINYGEYSNWEKFVEKNELYASYLRFFDQVKLKLHKSVFAKILLNTFKKAKSAVKTTSGVSTKVYRYIAGKNVKN